MNDKEKKELLERLKNHKEKLLQQIQNQAAEQAEQFAKEEIKIHECYYPETITYSFLFRYNGSKQETIPVEHKRYHSCPICHSKIDHSKANHSVYNTKRNNSTRLVQEEDETMKKRETEENQEENK